MLRSVTYFAHGLVLIVAQHVRHCGVVDFLETNVVTLWIPAEQIVS